MDDDRRYIENDFLSYLDAKNKPSIAFYLFSNCTNAGTFCTFSTMSATSSPAWKRLLAGRLPELGHRNWIGVVDAAYPLQTSAGIETIVTGTSHLVVLKEVLGALQRSFHVRPQVLLDAELKYLSETHAPGVSVLRARLAKLLAGQSTDTLPHEEIIAKLDTVGRRFHIVLFKTTLLLPYTSVFLELDCGYWSSVAERKLRNSLPRK